MQLPAPLTLTLPCPRPMLPCPPPVQVCERVLLELNPATAYTFPAFHTRIQEPYNYYAFGQRYIRWVGAGAERSGSAALQLVSICFTNATAAAGMPAATPCPALPCPACRHTLPALLCSLCLPSCRHAFTPCLPACRGLVDFPHSVLGRADRFAEINRQLEAGAWAGRVGLAACVWLIFWRRAAMTGAAAWRHGSKACARSLRPPYCSLRPICPACLTMLQART